MTSNADTLPPGLVRGTPSGGRWLLLLLLFAVEPIVFLINAFSVGTVVLAACCGRAIADLMPLEGDKEVRREIDSRFFLRLVLMSVGVFALRQLRLGLADTDSAGIGELAEWIGALALGAHFFLAFRPHAFRPVSSGPKELKAAVLSPPAWTERGAAMQASLPKFGEIPLFDCVSADLAQAWERRDTKRIETLLREGDALNRANWQRGLDLYNEAVAAVDAGRSSLQAQLAASEAMLASYAIDYSAIPLTRSDALGGAVARVTVQRDLSQKLNYSSGAAQALSRAATGAVPWQFAAAVAVGALVMQVVNQSKELRQLKEMEGQVTANAAAARGDFALMRDLVATRLLPQFDRMRSVVERLQAYASHLRVAEGSAAPDRRAMAMRLAALVVEGRHLTETMAGD